MKAEKVKRFVHVIMSTNVDFSEERETE